MALQHILEGTWRSRCEYGRGENDEPHISEHRIQLTPTDTENVWIGTSLPNKEGSEVKITVTKHGDELSGTWHERSSPSGYYQGKEFSGLLLLLQVDDATLQGMWLGAGSRARRVKSGMWTFEREDSDNLFAM